jgi:hypothetical protein
MKRSILICGILALLVMTPAKAQMHIGLGIRVGPPSHAHEVVIARPFRDAVWIPGFYRWHPHRHDYAWVPGHWTRAPRLGAAWLPERWERRNGEWVFYEGRWKDDRPAAHERRRASGRNR